MSAVILYEIRRSDRLEVSWRNENYKFIAWRARLLCRNPIEKPCAYIVLWTRKNDKLYTRISLCGRDTSVYDVSRTRVAAYKYFELLPRLCFDIIIFVLDGHVNPAAIFIFFRSVSARACALTRAWRARVTFPDDTRRYHCCDGWKKKKQKFSTERRTDKCVCVRKQSIIWFIIQ